MKTPKIQGTTLVLMGLLTAMEILLSRLFAIRTPIVTIGLGFIPITVAAMLFGPVKGGTVAALADFIGAVLFPIGAYFPGFTLTAFLTGVIYGLFLRERPLRLRSVILGVLLVNLVCSLMIDTYWLYLITGKGIIALLPARLGKCALLVPVQITVIQTLSRFLGTKALAGLMPAGPPSRQTSS